MASDKHSAGSRREQLILRKIPSGRRDTPSPASLARIIAKLRTLLDSKAPVAYQDETGFHFGQDPRES